MALAPLGGHFEAAPPRSRWSDWIEDAERIDLAIYAAIAGTPTPALDGAMRRISRAANYSRLSLASAALLALSGTALAQFTARACDRQASRGRAQRP